MLISISTLFSIGKEGFFERQILFWVISLIIFFSSYFIKYQNILRAPYIWIVMGISFIPLFINLFLANKSWINFGTFSIQPSEFARLSLLILLSIFLSKYNSRLKSNVYIAGSLFIIAPLILLLLAQPDFGMTMLYSLTWFFAILNFISIKQFLKIALGIFVIFLIVWFFAFKPYQKERIITMIFPQRDVLGSGYNLNQVKIAVGSAGFWGKGFGQGTQAKLGFLPSSETDFLLASFLEEWGIFGFLIYSFAVFLFLFSIYRENQFYSEPLLQTFGLLILIHFSIRFIFTTAMNLGIAPIVGLPTPFLSYGGSHLITDFLILSVWKNSSER
ncbi:MAG: FtsW/RodA/SpoVE family cell cycle protein [Patescibacteria group bacterium]